MLSFNLFPLKRVHWILLAQFALLFLFFFRPGIALRMNGVFDEPCYLAWTRWLMGDFAASCEGKQHFGGIALLWLPFALLAKGFSISTQTSIEESLVFFIGLSSFFYLGLSTFFLYLTMSKVFEKKSMSLTKNMESFPFLFICSGPVIYYATVRTLLPHAGELFLSSLLVYFGVGGKSFAAAGTAILLCLTRPQNIGCWAYVATLAGLRPVHKRTILAVGLIFLLVLSLWWGYFGYHQTYLLPSLLQVSFHKFVLFLLQVDFGVLWTQSIWILAFFYVLFLKHPTPNQTGLWIWMLVSALACIIWPTNGSSFGFRYLIGSYAAAWMLLLGLVAKAQTRKIIGGILTLTAVWNLALVWVFPAPVPLWPWPRPAASSIGWPFFVLKSWLENTGGFLSMLKFSSWGMLCEQFSACSSTEFRFMNQQIPYHLSGRLEKVLSAIIIVVVIFGGFSSLKLLLERKTKQRTQKSDPQ